MTRPSAMRRLGWALSLACPNCGARPIFRRWFRMERRCPQCGLAFERMPGYWLGAMILNFGFTAAAFIVVLLVGMAATWPDVPWTTLTWVGLAIGAVTPLVLFPWSRTLFSALEMAVRPPEAADFPESG